MKLCYDYNNEVNGMPTRMERYYRSNPDNSKRTSRNEELYKSIYKSGEYSNIEGITSIGNTNEIDITKLKEMLKSREEQKAEREYRNQIRKEHPIEIPVMEESTDRNYDIRDILQKAKTERTEEDNKNRSLKNTQYNILKNLNLEDIPEHYSELEKENKELKELIHTITSTSMLQQINDKDLSLELFSDLKSSDTTVDTIPVKKITSENLNAQSDGYTKTGIDHSFFTSSMGFKKEDFEDSDDFCEHKNKKIGKIALIICIVALALVSVVGIIIFLMNNQAI